MRLERIPILLYMFANIYLAYLGIGFVLALFFEDAMRPLSVAGQEMVVLFVSVCLFFISLLVSLSPLGEYILRITHGCEPITDSETLNRLTPLFNEVYQRAKEVSPGIADNIQLYIDYSDKTPNAFAIGRKSVCITGGLLDMSDSQIKSILAHEFGHLAHRDTSLLLAINISNYTSYAFMSIPLVFWGIFKLVSGIFKLISGAAGEGIISLIGSIFNVISAAIWWVFFSLFRTLWNIIGYLLITFTGRNEEYAADEFAVNLGYGYPLLAFFGLLNDAPNSNPQRSVSDFLEFFKTVNSTHPATHKRIENVKTKMQNHIPIQIISIDASEEFKEVA